jgi:topoisomerase-4 subunit A
MLRSKVKLTNLIKEEILALAELHGDDRRTQIVERPPAQAIAEADLVTSDPVTVVLSLRGWVRAAKGHEVEVDTLAYRSGDGFLSAALGRSNQPCIFLDSTGRAYNVATHTLPSARGQGEPLSGHLNPPDGASFCAVLIGQSDDRWVVASSAGYGFTVQLGELYTRNKAGKAALRVPNGSTVVPAARLGDAPAWIAAASSDGRLLLFSPDELPELSRGKGNKILALPAKAAAALVSVCVLAEGQSLKVLAGQREMTLKPKDLEHYVAARGRRGSALPRGWRKVDRLSAE